nr:hypothetical protein [Micromonospora sp. DSM 115978]
MPGSGSVTLFVGRRRWRSVGAGTGLLIGIILTQLASPDLVLFSTQWLIAAASGYFVGAFIAEFGAETPATGERRSAELRARRRSDYLTSWVLPTAYGLVVTALAVLVSVQVADPVGAQRTPLRFGLTVALIIVVVTIDAGTRQAVRRARPSGEAGSVAIHDELTTAAVHRLAGAGLCLAAWLLSWLAFVSLDDDSGAVRYLLTLTVGLVAIGIAVSGWFGVRTRWLPRRRRQELGLPR